MLAEIVDVLENLEKTIITSHERPDGDAIGSAIALGKGLASLGIEVSIVMEDPVPLVYSFLKGIESILLPSSLTKTPESIIVLDCTEWERTGSLSKRFNPPLIINIDHHVSNKLFATYNWVDSNAPATGAMVYKILCALGVDITEDIASALYTALATDTGFFQHANTCQEAFFCAAQLVAKGAKPNYISQQIHENRSLESLKILGLCLNSLQVSPGGKVAWVELPLSVTADLDIKEEHLDGLVNYPKSVAGVEVGLFFHQINSGQVRVGFRSKNYVDVNEIAEHFQGGGHKRAAGCIIEGEWQEVVTRVVQMAREKAGETSSWMD
ncbi:MAG: bifunctional oligoribonuclease/PAP phosphatase NrnA [Clostridia bacterium]|nr:bifunctional oligoribonuclease/PAP phosphatase NrnA [Clostridia bacterium]